MRSTLVLLLAIGCGGGGGANIDGNAGTGDGNPGDGTIAAFCDGSVHPIGNGLARAVGVDGQGRLLVLGTQAEPRQTMALRRLLANGDVDTSFGSAGVVTTPEQTDAEVFAVQADDSVIIAGGIVSGSGVDFVQAPLMLGVDVNGQPTGFRVTQAATSDDRYFQALMLQGSAYVVELDGALQRVGSDGTFDTSFGSAGEYAVASFAFAATADGFIIVAPQLGALVTYRLTADGQQVAGSTAMLSTDAYDLPFVLVAAGTDTATLVGKSTTPSPGTYDLLVARVLGDNSFDTANLGSNGFQVRANPSGGTFAPDAAFELADGSLLVGAETPNPALLHLGIDATLQHTYPIALDTIAGVTVWNGMLTMVGNKSSNTSVACLPM